MPSRPMQNTSTLAGSSVARSANLGEGTRSERLSRLKNLWRIVRGHLVGDVPITSLDLDPYAQMNHASAPGAGRGATPAPTGRPSPSDAPIEGDATVDEASDDSFPASDPPSFTSSRA